MQYFDGSSTMTSFECYWNNNILLPAECGCGLSYIISIREVLLCDGNLNPDVIGKQLLRYRLADVITIIAKDQKRRGGISDFLYIQIH